MPQGDTPAKQIDIDAVLDRLRDKAWSYADRSPNETLLLDAVGAILRLRSELETANEALRDCVTLIDDMSRFVGQMSLSNYQLFNEAPFKARAVLGEKPNGSALPVDAAPSPNPGD